MLKKANLSFFIFLISLMIWTSCATKKATGPSYVGKWKYEVPEMPGGDNTGVLVISRIDDTYKCLAITGYGNEQPMDNFDIQDGKIIASYDSQGTLIEVLGTIEGNTITGTIAAQGMTLDWSAIKVE